MDDADPESEALPYELPPRAGRGFLLAMLLTVAIAFAYLAYGPGLNKGYAGFGAMLAIPFALGALATGSGGTGFSTVGCILAPVLLFAVLFPIVYFGFGEGLVCILMVLPFWLTGGIGGGFAAWHLRRRTEAAAESEGGIRLKVSALLTLPFVLIYAEEMSPPQWQDARVSNSVMIAASADEVWPLLIAIPDIDAREGRSTFTHDVIGIPRPSGAEITERGDILVREAAWGDNIHFEEHVTRMIPGERIDWRFVFPDDSVQAHTDQHIDPAGPVVKIARGGYEIERIGDDRARLTLTTHYQMRTRLGGYFGIWGDVLLGDVHDNVLTIIKERAEKASHAQPTLAAAFASSQ